MGGISLIVARRHWSYLEQETEDHSWLLLLFKHSVFQNSKNWTFLQSGGFLW